MINKWYQTIDQYLFYQYAIKFMKTIFLTKCFEDKNLSSKHQSGFRPDDSCMYRLLAFIHDIFSCFECSL